MSKKTFCAHALLIARYGYVAAVVFEKVHFLEYESEKAPDYNTEDDKGVVWRRFELPRMLAWFEAVAPNGEIVSVVGTERSLRRAIDELVTAGLFIRKRRQVGFDLRIDFEALRAIVGDDEHYNLYPSPETECPKMDKVNEQVISELPNLDKQPPANTQSVQNLTNSMSTNGQSEMPNLDIPYIYMKDSLKEDSKEKDSKDSTTTLPNGSGAGAPAHALIFDDLLGDPSPEEEILPPKDVFAAISRITNYGLGITAHDRSEILAAMVRLQNTETAQKRKLVLDPEMIEDFAIWWIVIFFKGKDGFPTIETFENEFRKKFILNWYTSDVNRKQLEWIKRDFPDWRTRLFNGDFALFREEVQAYIAKQKQKKQQASQNFREQAAGATPVAEGSREAADRIFGKNKTNDT